MTDIVISGSGLYVPPNVVTNEELVSAYNTYVDAFNTEHQREIESGEIEALPQSSAEFIEKASGIRARYVLYKDGIVDPKVMRPMFPKRGEEQAPEMVEMAVHAAKQALEAANKTVEDVDLVIVACSNMQRSYPALAVELQKELGAGGYAYDMNVACSSATFGISNAIASIQSGMASVALVVNPEFASPQVNYKNRDSHFIFGDVCTATILEKKETCTSEHAFKVIASKLKTSFSNNIRCDYSYTDHCHAELPDDNPFFKQQGRKVFKELLPIVVDVITSQLKELEWSVESVRRMWLHQANINMNLFAAKKILGRDATDDEAPIILDEFANTASAGSIIAYHRTHQDLMAGDKAILCSFGAGYSVGCIALEKC
ncbi:beta-ketoacyl-ACP synthase III [Algicola sagamiensis]|uniref:beta-ketoacyl-ACP synthase III n=1 Tax=Algicola sagamiensis TaxID=163869 RepID=UPI000477CD68|nr:beta-ketoacyl-ACP synthase III [Algicola sagamiensis]